MKICDFLTDVTYLSVVCVMSRIQSEIAPVDKRLNIEITCWLLFQSPERLTAMGYQEKIEQATAKIGAKFIEYRIDTGSWVFEVSNVK